MTRWRTIRMLAVAGLVAAAVAGGSGAARAQSQAEPAPQPAPAAQPGQPAAQPPRAAEPAEVNALAEKAGAMVPSTSIPFYASWAGSPHAKKDAEAFNHWNTEGAVEAECARCHSTPGFIDYLGADGSAAGVVDHPAPTGTVITCIACHNEKTLRLTSVTFPSGVTVDRLGGEARCMTCHQGRESTDSVNKAVAGLDDDAVSEKLQFINVHYAIAGATLMGDVARGAYQYPGKTYAGRLEHEAPFDTCITCHDMHSTEVRVSDCAACHKEGGSGEAFLHAIRSSKDKTDYDGDGNVTEGIAGEVGDLHEKLLAAIQSYARDVAGTPIAYDEHAYPYFFVDKNGNGQADADEAKFPNRYSAWTPRLLRAAYNYQFVQKDPGAFAHNPHYVLQVLYDSLADLGSKTQVAMDGMTRP